MALDTPHLVTPRDFEDGDAAFGTRTRFFAQHLGRLQIVLVTHMVVVLVFVFTV